MATITEPTTAAASKIAPEQRVVLRGVSWETYKRLNAEVRNGGLRMVYNQGELELMSPGRPHEDFKSRLRRLIEVVTEEVDIPCTAFASTTWNHETQERGLEADECYMLTAEKVALCRPRSKEAKDCPSPDLAVEVDISPSAVDRPAVYAALRVPEVWRFNGDRLRIDRLRDDGTYETAGESLFLPVTPAEVERWVKDETDADDNAWARRLRAWVRAEVVPRRG